MEVIIFVDTCSIKYMKSIQFIRELPCDISILWVIKKMMRMRNCIQQSYLGYVCCMDNCITVNDIIINPLAIYLTLVWRFLLYDICCIRDYRGGVSVSHCRKGIRFNIIGRSLLDAKSRKRSSYLRCVISMSATSMAGIICSPSQSSIITMSIRKLTTSRFISGVVNTITSGVHKCRMFYTRSTVINTWSVIATILFTGNISIESLSILRMWQKSSKTTMSRMSIGNLTPTTSIPHSRSNSQGI